MLKSGGTRTAPHNVSHICSDASISRNPFFEVIAIKQYVKLETVSRWSFLTLRKRWGVDSPPL